MISAEQAIELLNSISSIVVEDDDVSIEFDDNPEQFSSREYIVGSFTRELFELIEDHIGQELPADMLKTLHSFTHLKIDCNELNCRQSGDESFALITSFIPGSFTRDLLELIENHMLGE